MKAIKIGDTFTKGENKYKVIYTVIDIYTVTNSKGKFIRKEYMATNDFLGQTITSIVPMNTILRNRIIT